MTDQATVQAPTVTHLERRIQTAKVEHQCSLCGHPIRVGQSYVRVAFVVDGEFRVLAYHVTNDSGEDECTWKR